MKISLFDPLEFYQERMTCPDYCPYDTVSDEFLKLLLKSEDVPFFEHRGFDINGIKTSIKKDIHLRSLDYGGSTISQQLAKNLYLSFEKTFVRKGAEALLTVYLEKKLTKYQILDLYLNIIFFGNGQYGITNASRFYFSSAPSKLTKLQSLFLVTMIPGPIYLSPFNHPERFTDRRKTMLRHLKLMKAVDDDFIQFVESEYPAGNVQSVFNLSGELISNEHDAMCNELVAQLRKKHE